MVHHKTPIIFFLACMLGLSACGTPVAKSQPVAPTALPAPTFTPAPAPHPSLWLSDSLPTGLRASIMLPEGWQFANDPAQATSRLEIGGETPSSRWIYALVAPFPTPHGEIAADELRSAWAGVRPADFDVPLMMDENTLEVFSALWGQPASGAVQVVPSENLLSEAWASGPAWAIVPFEQIEPRWKVLPVEGQSPLHTDFAPEQYALSVPVSFSGESFVSPASNRDPQKMTVVAMTGVTALVRATADLMEKKGVLYPGGDVRDLLRSADITHISNEVPFDPNCPRPDPANPALVFCSAPKYIELLEDIGTDVIELTGDHFIDPGPAATLYTLDMYRERGWPYFGGGRNLQEALSPAIFEHNGNKIAFIGCNAKGGGYATASDTYPGAGECGYDELHQEISRLAKAGYIVIATFSHQEYYTYQVKPEYRPDFTGMVDAGATIVQGSQAHQPQNFEFYKDGFIHYGLGNMFFDQILELTNDGLPIDSAFIDMHVIYDGKYINTELVPIKFIDFARPRPMTVEEYVPFLDKLFKASGWLGGKPVPTLEPTQAP